MTDDELLAWMIEAGTRREEAAAILREVRRRESVAREDGKEKGFREGFAEGSNTGYARGRWAYGD